MLATTKHRRRSGFRTRRRPSSGCNDQPPDSKCTRFRWLALYNPRRRQRRIHVASGCRRSDRHGARPRVLDGIGGHHDSQRRHRLNRLYPPRSADRPCGPVDVSSTLDADAAALTDTASVADGLGHAERRAQPGFDGRADGHADGGVDARGDSEPGSKLAGSLAQPKVRKIEIVLDRVKNLVGDFPVSTHLRYRSTLRR